MKNYRNGSLQGAVVVATLCFRLFVVQQVEAGYFTNAGNLYYPRYGHTATLLPSGKVLVAGGNSVIAELNSTVEIYNPATRTWAYRTNFSANVPNGYTNLITMNTPRGFHTATLLANGKVLVAGGVNPAYLSSAEIFDPVSETWTPTANLNTPRYAHTATLLPSGKVLIAGGANNTGTLSNTELYDPASGTWTVAGVMNSARADHTATLLGNGKVLVTGGYSLGYLSSAELFDPATGAWTLTGNLTTARLYHTTTLLTNGKVLAAGGSVGNIYLSAAEIYDPATGVWVVTGDLHFKRGRHTATLLSNGNVFVTGGGGSGGGNTFVYNNGELFDPAKSSWTTTGTMVNGRTAHQAVLLNNGKVLLVAGYEISYTSGAVNTSELYVSAGPIVLVNANKSPSSAFRFNFTNTPNASFSAFASTNLSLPLTNWNLLGGVTEISPGQFQFTDPQATNNPQRFYRVRAN